MTFPCGSFSNLPNDDRIPSQRVGLHFLQDCFGGFGGNDRYQLAFIGQVPGSKPKSSQAPRTSSLTGIRFSSTQIPTPDWRANSFSVLANPPGWGPGGSGSRGSG